MNELKHVDREIFDAISFERIRQIENIELIASENFVSPAVLQAQGSIMTNKYAEGYPGRRYYGGCEFVDIAEKLAIERLKKLFGASFANVQAHSGSQANMAVYRALLNHGDKILAMSLSEGGHLTHGYKLSFSGVDYLVSSYGVDPVTERIDYDQVERLALEIRPKMIVAGASAYPRAIDFARFRSIADKIGAYLFVDMAHIAGLVAGGVHQNPCQYAHVVSSTTHKTLRGPRGGVILTNDAEIAVKVDRAIFPGIQGGPLMHIIAAKAVAFKEDLEPAFKDYARQIVDNARTLSNELASLGYRIVSGGTDNHMLLVDLKSSINMTGAEAEKLLHEVGITCNKNSIPNDKEKPMVTSGIRLGTPAMTTRGFKENEFRQVAHLIDKALRNHLDASILAEVHQHVLELTRRFPLPY
ncbi:MAG: serine hydroxymethyltransferase [Bacteroidia bacterium]|nr:serine hydroxymethyltransferase [Bacteroidia bacterium]